VRVLLIATNGWSESAATSRLLADLGHDVLVQALPLGGAGRPVDVILAALPGVRLSDLGGVRRAHPDVPIIPLVAGACPPSAELAALGIERVLRLPLDPSELELALRNAVSARVEIAMGSLAPHSATVLRARAVQEPVRAVVGLPIAPGVVSCRSPEVNVYSVEEVITQSRPLLRVNACAPEVSHELRRAVESGTAWQGEFATQTDDGALGWERASVAPVRDARGNVTHLVAVEEDITEARREDAELQRLLEDTVGLAGHAVYDSIARWMLDWLGADACVLSELGGDGESKVLAVHRASAAADDTGLERILSIGGRCMSEGRVHKDEGLVAVALRDGDGRPLGMLCAVSRRSIPMRRERWQILNIVAARAAAEIRHQRANQELERHVGVIGAQHEALVRAQAHQERLTAMIVHDLKSPIAAVMGNAVYALERGGMDAEAAEVLEDIAGSTQRMHRMVLDMLDLGRSEGAAPIAKPRTIELGGLLAGVEAFARERLCRTGHRFSIDAPEPSVRLLADPDMVRRVLENLIDNAAKHAPRGTDIRLEVRAAADRMIFRVHDRGASVPAEQRQALFEAGSGLDQESSARGRSGLGLAFCRMVALAHGGEIGVEDDEPNGCVFGVWLPLQGAVQAS
jgi:signal transduction histidine kinase